MPRLFVTSKEIAWINDTVKELIKDVNGQKIYYYAISTIKSKINSTYDEAVYKMFENPIKLDVLAGQPDWNTKHDLFGAEKYSTLEILIQARDLIDKEITISEGDYFTFGDVAYEIQSYLNVDNIFGQVEYDTAFKIVGKLARPGAFDPQYFLGPTKDSKGKFTETGAQQSFVQQRGLPENSEGPTGDVRQIQEILGNEMAPPTLGEGPRRVDVNPEGDGNSFIYDE